MQKKINWMKKLWTKKAQTEELQTKELRTEEQRTKKPQTEELQAKELSGKGLRDTLCDAEKLKETIEFDEEHVIEEKEEIKALLEDSKQGIKRYPKENEEIIFNTKRTLFRLLHELIRAKYSLGLAPESIEEDYKELVWVVTEIGWEKIGYVHFIQVFALGILLEVPDEQLIRLIAAADKEKLDDCLFDFLVSACGLARDMTSKGYQEENPYQKTEAIIRYSLEDKGKASQELVHYMEKEWFQGHADYEWKNAHKRAGYVGFWSFETAAIAKILQLDDSELTGNQHYPYELAHFRNQRVYSGAFVPQKKTAEAVGRENTGTELGQNRDLDALIPAEFRGLVEQIIADYQTLSDTAFWEKYELEDVWYTPTEFLAENEHKNLLGTVIVNILVREGYILQLDYKEDVEDYADDIKNYWGDVPVKRVCFVLDNDQYYYALTKRDAHADKLYEVAVQG